jgi:hypothetical protein
MYHENKDIFIVLPIYRHELDTDLRVRQKIETASQTWRNYTRSAAASKQYT